MKAVVRKPVLMLCLLSLVGLLALTTAVAQEPLRIGFVSHQMESTDLFGQLEIGFRQALDDARLEYEYMQAAPSASHRHDEMLLILLEMSQRDLDYLVFGPSSLNQNTVKNQFNKNYKTIRYNHKLFVINYDMKQLSPLRRYGNACLGGVRY